MAMKYAVDQHNNRVKIEFHKKTPIAALQETTADKPALHVFRFSAYISKYHAERASWIVTSAVEGICLGK